MSIITDTKKELGNLVITQRTVWVFIAIMIAILALVDWRWYRFEGVVSVVIVLVGVGTLAIGVARWRLLVPLYRGWMLIALILGWFVMRILLVLTFILIFIPLRVLMRLMGKDLLQKKINRETPSYWIPIAESKDVKRYLKKF